MQHMQNNAACKESAPEHMAKSQQLQQQCATKGAATVLKAEDNAAWTLWAHVALSNGSVAYTRPRMHALPRVWVIVALHMHSICSVCAAAFSWSLHKLLTCTPARAMSIAQSGPPEHNRMACAGPLQKGLSMGVGAWTVSGNGLGPAPADPRAAQLKSTSSAVCAAKHGCTEHQTSSVLLTLLRLHTG